MTSGDRADIVGVADRRFQVVDQVQAWIGEASVHGFSPGLVSVASRVERRCPCWCHPTGAMVSAVKTLWAKAWPKRWPGRGGNAIRPNDQGARLCRADYEIVKVATHFEPARLFDPADLHRLEASGSDQPLDFVAARSSSVT